MNRLAIFAQQRGSSVLRLTAAKLQDMLLFLVISGLVEDNATQVDQAALGYLPIKDLRFRGLRPYGLGSVRVQDLDQGCWGVVGCKDDDPMKHRHPGSYHQH